MQAAPVKRPPVQEKAASTQSSRPGSGSPPGRGRRLWQAAAIAAIVLFAAINAGIWLRVGDDRVSHDLWNGAGSIDIAVDQFSRLKTRPHVVLLGSSLMMFPFWALDKQIDKSVPNIFEHRRSIALTQWLKQQGAPNCSVYSFAIFGQMVSDAYIYVNEFLKGDKAPDYLVFGIAPRDFHDNDLPAPMATYSFKRLVGLENFGRYSDLYLPSLQDKLDWLLGRVCYFYGHRWRLQHDVVRGLGRLWPGGTANATSKQNAQAGFMLAGAEDVRWKSSLAEYKRRYTNLDGKDIDLQMTFLSRLLELCRDRHIKVILVNMPLSVENRSIFPDGWYESFSRRVGEVATRYGADYLNIGADSDFQHIDFWDTTHLNNLGGMKLVKLIEPHLR